MLSPAGMALIFSRTVKFRRIRNRFLSVVGINILLIKFIYKSVFRLAG